MVGTENTGNSPTMNDVPLQRIRELWMQIDRTEELYNGSLHQELDYYFTRAVSDAKIAVDVLAGRGRVPQETDERLVSDIRARLSLCTAIKDVLLSRALEC